METDSAKFETLSERLMRLEEQADQQNDDKQFLQFEYLLNLYRALPNLKKLPQTRGWAASPDFLYYITETIFQTRPSLVLEAGSGTSTIIIAAALKLNQSGRLISLDHQEAYAMETRLALRVNDMQDNTQLICAPLTPCGLAGKNQLWYSLDKIGLNGKIDMLIIDGPPRVTGPLARYPAIPLLIEKLSDKAIILLDDANRADERLTVAKWTDFLETNQYMVTVETLVHYEKALAIFRIEKKT